VRLIAKLLSDFSRDESGATAIEYALIATGISIVIMVAVTSIGSSVNGRFVAVGDLLK
jgi:pilus assembly protein Flp/PilA